MGFRVPLWVPLRASTQGPLLCGSGLLAEGFVLQGFRSELSRFLGIPRVSSKPKACTQTPGV